MDALVINSVCSALSKATDKEIERDSVCAEREGEILRSCLCRDKERGCLCVERKREIVCE